MTCTKCNGLMLSEHILDFYAPVDRWKCINCGASPSINSSSSAANRSERHASNVTHTSHCHNRR